MATYFSKQRKKDNPCFTLKCVHAGKRNNKQSKNQKPKNLVFNEKGRDNYYETLEDLGETLSGNIKKGEVKEVVIEWQWKYETNESGDMQDTKDGNELKEYNFLIIARGEEKI